MKLKITVKKKQKKKCPDRLTPVLTGPALITVIESRRRAAGFNGAPKRCLHIVQIADPRWLTLFPVTNIVSTQYMWQPYDFFNKAHPYFI